jgi:serine protease AprX
LTCRFRFCGIEVILVHLSLKTTAIVLALSFGPICGESLHAASETSSSFLKANAVERPQKTEVIAPAFLECLQSRPDDTVTVWVLFTDKGVTDKASFATAAASVTLTDRAVKRRAKVGLDQVVFVDLPVVPKYIETIEAMGARHRRSSRWLNAASFEIDASLVELLARLPFVAEIRPIAQYQTPPEEPTESDLRETPPGGALSPTALNYGSSFNQLNQIGVPLVHEKGYTGAGVTLTIIDAGFRTSHAAFASHFAEGRVLAQYDFIQNDTITTNQPGDWGSEMNHGTNVWSIAGGQAPGNIYGPAYGANFILCKTEHVGIEMRSEEDNWVAAMEWADSIGTDVITSSLGYLVFDDSCHCSYTYADMDGQTAITSIAASMADGLGIVLCKSAGNNGPGASTITAPGDAFDILTVGSVDGGGTIASSSSRGPTADGRMKPEVCARGVSDAMAIASSDNAYGSGSGTSYAAPLVAGAACLVIEAHPDWTPYQVREALKHSGTRATNPDNNYGWGIINVNSALAFWCCTGKVGNVNGTASDQPTIGDVSNLIDILFIRMLPPACMGEADINQSGGEFPQQTDITIGDISVLIDYLFISQAPLPDCL